MKAEIKDIEFKINTSIEVFNIRLKKEFDERLDDLRQEIEFKINSLRTEIMKHTDAGNLETTDLTAMKNALEELTIYKKKLLTAIDCAALQYTLEVPEFPNIENNFDK